MTLFNQALVIGKFYPPHNGHLALIQRAAARSTHLAVIVMASQLESIPLSDRVDWLREDTAALDNVTVLGIPSDAPVDYEAEIAWVANVEAMRAALRLSNIHRIDAVFGAEPYVTELAARFDATPVLDDRAILPMSGTAARADLAAEWMSLPPATRRGLATRVIVVGAESTGTTTLTTALVDHYRSRFPDIRFVEEYGRTFTYELFDRTFAEAHEALANTLAESLDAQPQSITMDDLVWTADHFELIANHQTELENAAAEACPLVIADTDAFATAVWERRYLGEDSHGATLEAGPLLPRRDLYLITDHVGVPFKQDGWRDGEHIRADMTRWFIDGLTERGAPWVLLRGSREERLRYAIEAIEPLLLERMTLR
jgi:nicotinamide riboside kinase